MQSAKIPQSSDDLDRVLDELAQSPIDVLRQKYSQLYSLTPPVAFGPDLLRRSIAQKLQENASGGLDRATARLLNQLITQSAKNNGNITIPRRIKPGAVLVREWKGVSHRVTVAAEGYVYKEQPYSNLSEIARFITGTRWKALIPMSDLSPAEINDLAMAIYTENKIGFDPLYDVAKSHCDEKPCNLAAEIVSILYRVGAIGVKLRSGERYIYAYADHPLLPASQIPETEVALRVHPMLWGAFRLH